MSGSRRPSYVKVWVYELWADHDAKASPPAKTRPPTNPPIRSHPAARPGLAVNGALTIRGPAGPFPALETASPTCGASTLIVYGTFGAPERPGPLPYLSNASR